MVTIASCEDDLVVEKKLAMLPTKIPKSRFFVVGIILSSYIMQDHKNIVTGLKVCFCFIYNNIL